MLSRFVIAFFPRREHLLISWLQSPFTRILESKEIRSIKYVTASTLTPFFAMKSQHGCPDLSREILRKIKSRTGQALRDQPNPFNDFLKHVQLLTKACNIFLKLLFPCDANWFLCGCTNCKPRKFGYCIVHRSWGQKDGIEGLEKERLEDSLLPKLVQVS